MGESVDILTAAKTAVRVSGSEYDDEIQGLIDTAIADLGLSGIDPAAVVDSDALVRNAILTYVKATFGFDNPDAKRLEASYESYKKRLRFSPDHTGGKS